MSDYQKRLDFALAQTYDLNNTRGTLRYTLDEQGRPQELISGHAPVTGYGLVVRMELAYAQIKRLEAGIATHRRLLSEAMQRAEQEQAEGIVEDAQ